MSKSESADTALSAALIIKDTESDIHTNDAHCGSAVSGHGCFVPTESIACGGFVTNNLDENGCK